MRGQLVLGKSAGKLRSDGILRGTFGCGGHAGILFFDQRFRLATLDKFACTGRLGLHAGHIVGGLQLGKLTRHLGKLTGGDGNHGLG